MGMPSMPELIIILVIIVLLFGAKKIPDLAKGLGSGIKNFKDAMKEDEVDNKVATNSADKIEENKAETTTASGIIIPDTAKEKPMEGKVIAVGTGSRAEDGSITPMDVTVGDRILFGKWSGTEVKIDGTEYLIMKESDIMGVIEGKAA